MLERLCRAADRLRPQTQGMGLDVGFRTFRLQPNHEPANEATTHAASPAEVASELTKLFQLIASLGLPLNLPLQELQAGQTKYYLYDYRRPYSGLAFCFKRPTSKELQQLLAHQPSLLILPEQVFANDGERERFIQKCQTISPTTDVKVLK